MPGLMIPQLPSSRMKSLVSFFSFWVFFVVVSFRLFSRINFCCISSCWRALVACVDSCQSLRPDQLIIESCVCPSDNLISLSYLMPAFSVWIHSDFLLYTILQWYSGFFWTLILQKSSKLKKIYQAVKTSVVKVMEESNSRIPSSISLENKTNTAKK